MHPNFTLPALLAGLATLLLFCTPGANHCPDINGRWSNREGQIFSFDPGGKGLWLVKFGSKYDTFPIAYRYDCGKKTTTLDLSDFKTGPMAGKTQYGIIEWSGDTLFRMSSETGSSEASRPQKFDPEHVDKFYRE